MAAPSRTATSEHINLRASSAQKALIDRAAAALGKSRTEFMLDTMREASENVLLDRRVFSLGEEEFAAFEAALNAPSDADLALAKTLTVRPPWDR